MLQQTWAEMEKLVDEGLVAAIGISNFSVKKTKELLSYARIKPAANQVELHPYFRNSAISEYCKKPGNPFHQPLACFFIATTHRPCTLSLKSS